ncbi:MAG: hypothetical protein M3530_02065 [Thermoproteota archaeon]|nr:hypothetical protein [Thermoproteota archaeon]
MSSRENWKVGQGITVHTAEEIIKFTIIDRLEGGGFGEVWLVKNKDMTLIVKNPRIEKNVKLEETYIPREANF